MNASNNKNGKHDTENENTYKNYFIHAFNTELLKPPDSRNREYSLSGLKILYVYSIEQNGEVYL